MLSYDNHLLTRASYLANRRESGVNLLTQLSAKKADMLLSQNMELFLKMNESAVILFSHTLTDAFLRSPPTGAFKASNIFSFQHWWLKRNKNTSQVRCLWRHVVLLSLAHVGVCVCALWEHTAAAVLPDYQPPNKKKIFSKPTSGTSGEMIKFSMWGVQKQ